MQVWEYWYEILVYKNNLAGNGNAVKILPAMKLILMCAILQTYFIVYSAFFTFYVKQKSGEHTTQFD